jgi:hypothetical protein
MLPKLDTQYKRMSQKLDATLTYMEQLHENQRYAAGSGEWSAAQILYHLMMSETGTVNYLKKKMQASPEEVGKGGIMAAIRSLLLRRALRNYKKKFKAPKVAAEVPPRPAYEATRDAYLKIRKELATILSTFTKEMEPIAYFKHPRAGRLTIAQTLNFLEDHFDRHYEQMQERSRKA